MMKKPRSDAKLKTLPEDRQREIYEKLKVESLASVRSWLRDDGIHVSLPALSSFFSWYQLTDQYAKDAETTETLLEQLKREVPVLSDAQLDELGQRTFSLLAIRNQDPDGFLKVRSARFKAEIEREKLRLRQEAEKRQQEALKLEKKRFQRETIELFMEWFQDKEARRILTSKEPKADRTEKLGQLIFKEDW